MSRISSGHFDVKTMPFIVIVFTKEPPALTSALIVVSMTQYNLIPEIY